MLVYFLQQLDKSVLSFSAVFGLSDDLGLQANQYSWLSSIIYIAQFFAQPRESSDPTSDHVASQPVHPTQPLPLVDNPDLPLDYHLLDVY